MENKHDSFDEYNDYERGWTQRIKRGFRCKAPKNESPKLSNKKTNTSVGDSELKG